MASYQNCRRTQDPSIPSLCWFRRRRFQRLPLSNVVDFGDLVLGNGKCEFNHEGVVFEVGIEDVDDSDINVITVIGFLMFTLGERKNLHIVASVFKIGFRYELGRLVLDIISHECEKLCIHITNTCIMYFSTFINLCNTVIL